MDLPKRDAEEPSIVERKDGSLLACCELASALVRT